MNAEELRALAKSLRGEPEDNCTLSIFGDAADALESCAEMMEAKPVAYVVQSLRDGSIGMQIAPVRYATFERLKQELEADPRVKNGLAKLSPLYAAPSVANFPARKP